MTSTLRVAGASRVSTAVFPAKDLRALIGVKGVAGTSDEYKALVLKRAIQERLDDAARHAGIGSAASGSPPCGAAPPQDRR